MEVNVSTAPEQEMVRSKSLGVCTCPLRVHILLAKADVKRCREVRIHDIRYQVYGPQNNIDGRIPAL
jgi:hypothetical protein